MATWQLSSHTSASRGSGMAWFSVLGLTMPTSKLLCKRYVKVDALPIFTTEILEMLHLLLGQANSVLSPVWGADDLLQSDFMPLKTYESDTTR